MAFQRCGRDDPFTKRVRTLYRANVLRAPRSGVDPLQVLAVQGRRVEVRGALATLLAAPDVDLPTASPHSVADLAGIRSASLDLKVGLNLTGAFLTAIGLPIPGADVAATLWTGASAVEFEVRDVTELRVDLGLLGRALAGRVIDDNAATRVFLTDRSVRMLVITRTLVSQHFAVHATGRAGQDVQASVRGLENLLGKTNAAIEWACESSETISFKGASPVTFAFGAVPCAIQPDRSLVFGVELDDLTFGTPERATEFAPVIDEDGLLDFDAVG